MLIIICLLFILLLAAVLVTLFKIDGFSVKNSFRQARLEQYAGGKERRQHSRVTQCLQVVYSVMKKALPNTANGKTMDISEGGLKLLLDEKLPLGSFLNLKISLPGSAQPAEVSGSVVWTEDAPDIKDPSGKRFFYSGIKFTSIKDPSGKKFLDYVRSLIPGRKS